ncbi:INO80 complex subunit C [Onthophagus taurus]|uniref:INO80 complex subunit C n=1 Tax=Onthophagus taurus TaxID=166361 RepID=UPI000C1FE124|nr:INO80 complex subunit C [Onthophagus taurus]
MSTPTEELNPEEKPVFKLTSFQMSAKVGNKKRMWKSLKQVISSERSLPWPEDYVHYSSINAPPSFTPAEKFSDLSGLPAPYTDPQTRLRFANKEEYATIVCLPMDITAGYLSLRGASSIVG